MKTSKFIRSFVTFLVILTFTPLIQGGCGGGGGGGGGTPPALTEETPGGDKTADQEQSQDQTETALFTGFDFSLKEGDFWEFGWDVHTSTAYSGGGGSGTTTGSFRITLGTPTTIDGMTAYPMLLSGDNNPEEDGTGGFVIPRWSHIAVSNHKIYLSDDGISMKEVFDAMDGTVLGFGFFSSLGESTLFEVGSGTISNDYMDEAAYLLKYSEDQSRCEYFGEYGTICGGGDEDYTITQREYYQAGIGPVGYYKYFGYSTGGTFDSYSRSETINIGLTACSLRGDVVDYDLETEPNDSPETAQYVNFPMTIKGNVLDDYDPYDKSTYIIVNALNEVEPNDSSAAAQPLSVPVTVYGDTHTTDASTQQAYSYQGSTYFSDMEDWYSFSFLPGMSGDIRIKLDIENDATADLDLFLFDDSASTTVGVSGTDNPGIGDPTELISETLYPAANPVTYRVVVDAYATPSDRVNYTLDISFFGERSSQRHVEEWYSFTLAETTEVTITLNIDDFDNEYKDLDLFLFDSSATVLLGSSVKDNPDLNDPTEAITTTLDPGTYIVGVDALWSCNYTLTIE